jgi:hypothetical protein
MRRLSHCWGCRPVWLTAEEDSLTATITMATITMAIMALYNQITARIVMTSAAGVVVATALVIGAMKTVGTLITKQVSRAPHRVGRAFNHRPCCQIILGNHDPHASKVQNPRIRRAIRLPLRAYAKHREVGAGLGEGIAGGDGRMASR